MGVKGAYKILKKIDAYEKVEGSLRDALLRANCREVYVDVYCNEYNSLRRLCLAAVGQQQSNDAIDKFLDHLNEKYIVATNLKPADVFFVIDGEVSEAKLNTYCLRRKK